MHHRILGLGSTLAFLFVGYAAGWLSDPNEISFVADKPNTVELIFRALVVASVFTLSVLFILVWPQTLLASWIVRRFEAHRLVPFGLFFGISSVAVCIVDFTIFDNERLIAYLVCTGYLLVACSILWLISFRRRPVA